MARIYSEEFLPALRARARNKRSPPLALLSALEGNVHGPLAAPLRAFLQVFEANEFADGNGSGVGFWDLLPPADVMAPSGVTKNLFEEVVLYDQEHHVCHAGLLQLATATIPVGIKDSSDLYYVSTLDQTVNWFVPEDDGEMVGVAADSIETLASAALLDARAAGGADVATMQSDLEAMEGRCMLHWVSHELPDGTCHAVSKTQGYFDRALPWLYALSPYLWDSPDDDDMTRNLLGERLEAVDHVGSDIAAVYGHAKVEENLADAFYFLWRRYFWEEPALADVVARCLRSDRRIIVDMARMAQEFTDGRKELGKVKNMPEVRSWLKELRERSSGR